MVVGTLYIVKLDRFVLIAAATDTEGSFYLEKLKVILLIVSVISLFLFSLAGWLYSGRALYPISEVIKKVETISASNLNHRIPVHNESDEIGKLTNTFNNMLSRLEKSFAFQKEFISNASHELRTPLTAINGQLEVLMMNNRTMDEYKEAISSVLDDTHSLSHLINKLLLVARTNSEAFLSSGKKIRIDELVWQAKDDLMKYNSDYSIHIAADDSFTDSDQMIVTGDESLLRIAISNIMDNACKYSPDKKVEIGLSTAENRIVLRFADQGIGIAENEIEKVFEPFYRVENALAFQGTGIGLQLASQIIKSHQGTLNISSKIGKGTIVTLSIPIAL